MRNFLVVFASLVAAASVAHADPLSPDTAVTDAAAPIASETAPSTYVLGGVMAGGNDDLLTAGGTVEAGTRVVDHVWLHGSFTEAAADELFARGTGSLMQARVGADLMGCANKTFCAFLGADVGFQHSQFSGMSEPLWGGDNGGGGNPIDESHSSAIGVARVGLDIGGTNLRWRPGIEASMASDGYAGLNLTQSIAYRF